MRVLHVVRRFDPLVGGTERYVGDLARAQAVAGHAVTVVTLDRDVAGVVPGRLPADEVRSGVRVVRLPGFGSGRFALTTRPDRLLAAVRRADVVHLHDLRFQPGLVAMADAVAGRPTLWHTHGLIFHTAAWLRLKRFLFRLYYGPVLRVTGTTILCSSDADREVLGSVGPSLARSARVLPNGVDLGPFIAVRTAPVAGRIVVIGRVAPSKGIDALLRALATISESTWTLEVHGAAEPGEIDRLTAIANALGLAPRVTFHGAFATVDEPAILREAALAAFPSHGEGFGIALLDAMAAGVPVVASDLPAHRLLLSGEPQLLVDIGDQATTGRRVREVLALEPDAAAALGARLRTAAARYEIGSVVEELDSLYRSLPLKRSATIQPKNRGSSQR